MAYDQVPPVQAAEPPPTVSELPTLVGVCANIWAGAGRAEGLWLQPVWLVLAAGGRRVKI